jgi:hypothetical protein
MRNLAVVVGVGVAIVSVVTARGIARKKQSADMLFNSRGDERLQAAYRRLIEYHNGEKNIRLLAIGEERKSEECKDIRYLLNHLESLAVGIDAGIYDEPMLKSSWCGIVTDTYTHAATYISAVREQDKRPTIYQELEWLAKRWARNPLKVRPQ